MKATESAKCAALNYNSTTYQTFFIMSQTNQKKSVNALNAINFKLGDISSGLRAIADLCKFYGVHDNLDERSRREEALDGIRCIAKKAHDDVLSLNDAVDALFPENEIQM